MALARSSLAVVVVAIFTLLYAQSAIIKVEHEFIAPRSNLSLGILGASDVLLFRTNATRKAVVNQRISQDVPYLGKNVNITYISVAEVGVTQNATVMLLSGGIRQANATVRITSAVSRGYNYTYSVWGRR